MEKIILIFALFLISCNDEVNFTKNPVVISINRYKCCYCEYGLEWGSIPNTVEYSGVIKDSCGKYQIGDTIKTIKK